MSVAAPTSWQQIVWQRPLDPARVAACLRQWAADQRSSRIVLETRVAAGATTYLVGQAAGAAHTADALRALPNAALRPASARSPVSGSAALRMSTRHRPLQVADPLDLVRAVLALSLRLRDGEQLVLQLVLGPRRVPLAIPQHSPSSVVMPWWQVAWLGNGGQVDGEKRQALRTKVSDHGFACTVRLGVTAASIARRRALLLSLLAAIRISEGPGVRLRLRREPPSRLNGAVAPLRWPLRLGVPELTALTCWPLGDGDLPGQPPAHPKVLPPAPGTTGTTRVVAEVALPGSRDVLSLPPERATHGLHVLGPTGTGKSNLLSSLILQDIAAGHGVVVVEPKGDLVEDVLARIPSHRQADVVVLDAHDPHPVGLNPLSTAQRSPELVADALLAVFKQLYGKNVGPRSQDILYAGLLTLARRPNATLVMLPLLFTNDGLRRSLTANLRDPLVLEPFWATFEHWSAAERANAVAPILNKVRALLRPGLRAVVGQRQPRFDMADVFRQRKILLVPLQRGVIGPEAASLLGSLVVAALWQSAQARGQTARDSRHPVMVYIDEVQDYLHLPTDLANALEQARGYGVALALSHQNLDQLPKEMRAAVLANARSRVAFQLPHTDALVLEKGHPELSAADFEQLGRFEVYASLFARGAVSPYASGRTRPLPAPSADPAALRLLSRARYGQPLDVVERGFAELYGDASGDGDLGLTGRRRR